ncbi:superoxide dismutase [Cu-Zn]-like [Amyelois transitella]|uniref:superoxide dismutase [Cu-Zn]-like n=1 Tax=Amyelois transitella TaxID=680683 RepID=UPI00067B8000|nr:superoxide dismutase [Cu-Zn]-like [Amyelois transitella]
MIYHLAICLTISFVTVTCEREAVAQLVSSDVSGSIWFTEIGAGIRVHGRIVGLGAGNYGFHIHEFGDTTTCEAAGSHFNPDGTVHGGRDHALRHVGDLGNIQFDENGVAEIDFVDHVIALRGRNNVLGRTLILHEGEDDLGLGGAVDSLTTGNAGSRLACGVIGLRSPVDPWRKLLQPNEVNLNENAMPSVFNYLLKLNKY